MKRLYRTALRSGFKKPAGRAPRASPPSGRGCPPASPPRPWREAGPPEGRGRPWDGAARGVGPPVGCGRPRIPCSCPLKRDTGLDFTNFTIFSFSYVDQKQGYVRSIGPILGATKKRLLSPIDPRGSRLILKYYHTENINIFN